VNNLNPAVNESFENHPQHEWGNEGGQSMTFTDFKASLQEPLPPEGLSKLLTAMWHDAKGDWSAAHEIAQDVDTPEGAWIHAYLHRKEGDNSNAAYWYRLAKQKVPDVAIEDEWETISKEFIVRLK
jgi:hypothetical protein